MSLPEILEDLERQLIQRAYDKSGGVKTETARLLGIKTSALYYKLEKYGIGVIESRSDKAARRGGGAGGDARRRSRRRRAAAPGAIVRAESTHRALRADRDGRSRRRSRRRSASRSAAPARRARAARAARSATSRMGGPATTARASLGKRTASGERYDPNEMTAAHKTLPFGTRVRVTRRRRPVGRRARQRSLRLHARPHHRRLRGRGAQAGHDRRSASCQVRLEVVP